MNKIKEEPVQVNTISDQQEKPTYTMLMDQDQHKLEVAQKQREFDRIKRKSRRSKRLIRIRDVIRLTGISKSYIYQLVSQNIFPKAVQLIPGGSSVAWVESEVLDWIDSRIQERNNEVNHHE